MSTLLSDEALAVLQDQWGRLDNVPDHLATIPKLLAHIDALSIAHATALREAEIAAVRRGAELMVENIGKPFSSDCAVAAYKREKGYDTN